MNRDHGLFALQQPILAMLLNAVRDRHAGRVFVLHVGAGNGEGQLPLLPRFQNDGWSGLLIEPHPGNFAQLESLHAKSDGVAVLNLGISDVSASLVLHSLSPEAEARNRRLPRGRASLIRDRIATAGVSDADILSAEVPFVRLDTVLGELGLDSARLVVVNAGGHEAQVMSSFALARLDPSLVLIHATPGTASDDACIAALKAADLLPFRVGGWLVGLAPARLAVPLEELLTSFQNGGGAPQDSEE